eukprot:7010425-Prymnesium_polylepis.1
MGSRLDPVVHLQLHIVVKGLCGRATSRRKPYRYRLAGTRKSSPPGPLALGALGLAVAPGPWRCAVSELAAAPLRLGRFFSFRPVAVAAVHDRPASTDPVSFPPPTLSLIFLLPAHPFPPKDVEFRGPQAQPSLATWSKAVSENRKLRDGRTN